MNDVLTRDLLREILGVLKEIRDQLAKGPPAGALGSGEEQLKHIEAQSEWSRLAEAQRAFRRSKR